ncbi:MAG: lipopolysaccharide biosynthesis protein, partial [Nitrospinota bacterium]
VVGVNLAIGFLFKPFEATLVAYNRFDFLNAVGVTFSIVRAISIVIVLKSGYGVVEMAYTILFLDMLNHVVIFCLSKKIFAGLQLGCKFVHKDSVTKLINFGFFNFLREISRFILNKTDTILVGIFLGTSVVAVYAIAESLISYTSSITKGITRVLLPLSSELNAKDQTAKIKKIMLLIPKYIFLGSVFIWTEFYFLGDQFILLWLGTGFHESYIIFCILMAARVSVMTHDIMVISVVGIGKNKFFGWLSVFEMLANLTLSLILVKKIGLLGVAFGTLLPLLITRSIIVPVYCSKIVHISLKEYLSNIISPTVVCSIPYVLVTSQLVLLLPPDNYLTLCLNFLLSFLVLMIFFYRFLEIEIKKTIVKTFGRFAWSR